MLTVKTPDEVLDLIRTAFTPLDRQAETVPLDAALGRVLASDIQASEFVPGFDRSTVDGYALRSADTFGCSDAFPALLTRVGEVLMGEAPPGTVGPDQCMAIPTGGALPPGADGVQMVEYSEDYGDGTIGILKSVAPGNNLIFKGDDVKPGDLVLPASRRLQPQDIGALAALGVTEVPVLPRVRVGVLSTGDEIVPPERVPGPGEVRDVNAPLMGAVLTQAGARVTQYGIFPDNEPALRAGVAQALAENDLVVLSGGSSVGTRDAAVTVLSSFGELLFHGVAMKPGKPTLLARAGKKPLMGLPGHPVAALFSTHLFVCPLLARLEGRTLRRRALKAILTETVGANHGRAQYNGVFLREENGTLLARPIRGKSGLITTLAGADGYFCIPRDCEGFAAGTEIPVITFTAQ